MQAKQAPDASAHAVALSHISATLSPSANPWLPRVGQAKRGAMSGHPDGLTALSDIDDNSPASQPLHTSPGYHSPHSYPINVHPGDSPIAGPPSNMLDVVSFGCPPGDFPVEDHAAALAHLLQDDVLLPPSGSDPASGDSASGNIVSSFRGVSFSKGKWTASVMVNGR